MARTLSGIAGLLAFVVCLMTGVAVGNTFSTSVWRAVIAMCGTCVIGLIVGAMGQKMLDENKAQTKREEEKLKENPTETPVSGR